MLFTKQDPEQKRNRSFIIDPVATSREPYIKPPLCGLPVKELDVGTKDFMQVVNKDDLAKFTEQYSAKVKAFTEQYSAKYSAQADVFIADWSQANRERKTFMEDLVREAIQFLFPPASPEEVHLESKAGDASRTMYESVPDLFAFPTPAKWRQSYIYRQNWWARASFVIKFRGMDSDEYAYLGQCTQYAKELLRCCPIKEYGVAVLFSLTSVRVIVADRARGTVKISEPMDLVKGQGLACLGYAARKSLRDPLLPWSLASVLGAHPEEKRGEFCYADAFYIGLLGEGNTASAFHVRSKSLKLYKLARPFSEFRDECRALTKINAVRSALPDGAVKRALPELLYHFPEQLTGEDEVEVMAVVTLPVGIPMLNRNVGDLWLSAYIPIVQALKSVHAQGLVHRDIGPSNCICIANGELALIDWTCAVGVVEGDNTSEAHVGTVWFGADGLMELFDRNWRIKQASNAKNTNFNAQTDLESVVKTIAFMTVPGMRTCLEERRAKLGSIVEPECVLDLWKDIWQHDDTRFILPLRDLARAGDHDGMAEELARLHDLFRNVPKQVVVEEDMEVKEDNAKEVLDDKSRKRLKELPLSPVAATEAPAGPVQALDKAEEPAPAKKKPLTPAERIQLFAQASEFSRVQGPDKFQQLILRMAESEYEEAAKELLEH